MRGIQVNKVGLRPSSRASNKKNTRRKKERKEKERLSLHMEHKQNERQKEKGEGLIEIRQDGYFKRQR